MELRYGIDRHLTIDDVAKSLIPMESRPLNDSARTPQSPRQAVAQPLDFPPLSMCVVPGDRVALPLSPGVPDAAEVVAAIVEALVAGGVSGSDISLVQTRADAESGAPDPRSRLPDELRESVQWVLHEPSDREQLSYLAADDQAEPIYVNRQIGEADLVIPIGCLRPSGDMTVADVARDEVYPTFGDRKAIDHLSPTGQPQTKGQLAHRRKQIDHVARLLGVQVTAQVVPHVCDQPVELLVGTPEQVLQTGQALYRESWEQFASSRAHLVIAAIGGDEPQQSWDNLGRALHAALGLVDDGGAVVLCCDVNAPLGPALRVLAAAPDAESALPRLRKSHAPDAPLARALAESLDRVSIYLLSQLDEETTASIGMVKVADEAEVERLVARSKSCIVLGDAQYAIPIVRGESQPQDT